MLNLWYTHTIADDDQEFLMHRQLRKATEAISTLHYPQYPTVKPFTSWSEIQSALGEALAEPAGEVFVYILAFGALDARKAGDLRVGSLLLNRQALESLVAKPNVHLHVVCDPTLNMAALRTEKAIGEELAAIRCGPTLTLATVVKASKQIRVRAPRAPEEAGDNDDDDAPDPRSYYCPKMPRFTEIYFRCLVDAVHSKDDLRTLVHRGLEGAYIAAVQLSLRYQPEVMQLRPFSDGRRPAAHRSDDALRSICRGYAYLPTPSCQLEENAQSLAESTQLPFHPSHSTRHETTPVTLGPTAPRSVSGAQLTQGAASGEPVVSLQLNDLALTRRTAAASPYQTAGLPSSPPFSAPMGPFSYVLPQSATASPNDSTLSLGATTVAANSFSTPAGSSEPSTLDIPVLERGGIEGASQVASPELARRFTAGPKGMVLHIGPFANPSMDNGQKVCPVCTMTLPEDVTWTDHVLTEQHLQSVGDPLPHAQYYCYICSAIVSGDKNLTLHVEGTCHRTKVQIGICCGYGGSCAMLLFTEPDLAAHHALCHGK